MVVPMMESSSECSDVIELFCESIFLDKFLEKKSTVLAENSESQRLADRKLDSQRFVDRKLWKVK